MRDQIENVVPLPERSVTEDDIIHEERRIGRIAWTGTLSVVLVTASVFLAVVVREDTPNWKYGVYVALAGIPFLYGAFSTFVMRRMQATLFRRYQAQLLQEVHELQGMVYRDELTGLYNRRHFTNTLQAEVSKAQRNGQPLALLMIDLDGLKKINDEYGHSTGDIVLANLGKAIARQIRGEDVPARLGGDEFGVVMPATDKRGAFALARRLWGELEQTPMYYEGDSSLMVTVSIGVAGYPWGGETVEEMMQWADADMYANKVSQRLPKDAVSAESEDALTESLLDDFPAGFRG